MKIKILLSLLLPMAVVASEKQEKELEDIVPKGYKSLEVGAKFGKYFILGTRSSEVNWMIKSSDMEDPSTSPDGRFVVGTLTSDSSEQQYLIYLNFDVGLRVVPLKDKDEGYFFSNTKFVQAVGECAVIYYFPNFPEQHILHAKIKMPKGGYIFVSGFSPKGITGQFASKESGERIDIFQRDFRYSKEQFKTEYNINGKNKLYIESESNGRIDIALDLVSSEDGLDGIKGSYKCCHGLDDSNNFICRYLLIRNYNINAHSIEPVQIFDILDRANPKLLATLKHESPFRIIDINGPKYIILEDEKNIYFCNIILNSKKVEKSIICESRPAKMLERCKIGKDHKISPDIIFWNDKIIKLQFIDRKDGYYKIFEEHIYSIDSTWIFDQISNDQKSFILKLVAAAAKEPGEYEKFIKQKESQDILEKLSPKLKFRLGEYMGVKLFNAYLNQGGSDFSDIAKITDGYVGFNYVQDEV